MVNSGAHGFNVKKEIREAPKSSICKDALTTELEEGLGNAQE